MLTVLDLARGAPLAGSPLVVVVSADGAVIGLVADAADEVRTLLAADLHDTAGGGASAVVGTTADGIALLDPAVLVPRATSRSTSLDT